MEEKKKANKLKAALRRNSPAFMVCLGGAIACFGLAMWSVPLGITALGGGCIALGLIMAKGDDNT